uniref:Peptidase M12B domain-containing protein n=1 Tax=Panagrellus redivivus TaxID=6233 RepID=A0A7E4UXN5_PANRE
MAPFLVILLFAVVAADLNSVLQKHEIVQPHFRDLDPGSILLSFNAFGREFVTQLTRTQPTATAGLRVVDSRGRELDSESLTTTRYYSGFMRGCPHCSTQVTIHEDSGEVYGTFHTDDDTLYLEPITPNNGENKVIAYWASDVKAEALKHIHGGDGLRVPRCPEKKFINAIRRVKRDGEEAVQSRRVKKNRCEMKLVADYEFYKTIGNKNYYTVVRYLTNAMVRVNKLYEAVNWGKSGDGEDLAGLGFVLKELKIYDKPMPRPKHATDHWHQEHFNYEGEGPANIQSIMTSFSTEEGTNETCVTVLATGKIGDNGILGLAVKGTVNPHNGACAKIPTNGIYLNTGVVTVRMKESVMITRIFDLVLAHELGHIWGAHHDKDMSCNIGTEEFPLSGRYIMHETENTGYDANNYQFSKCSRMSIWRLMYNVQPWCFVEESNSVCGNGVLEPGEECDPGGYWLPADSASEPKPDRCCTRRCKLVPNARCSPRHSDCCAPTCDYQPTEHLCLPQNNETCKQASHCTGSSHFCPTPVSVADGTGCYDEGTCKSGRCKSVCEMHDPKLRPCLCENMSNACHRCCKEGKNGKCQPLDNRRLPDGSICFFGQCKSNVCVKKVADVVTQFWNIVSDFQSPDGSQGHFLVFFAIIGVTGFFVPFWFWIIRYDLTHTPVEPTEQPEEADSSVEFVNCKKIIKKKRQDAVRPETNGLP